MIRGGWARGANTYDVNSLVPGNTNLGALRTQINTDNAHFRQEKWGYMGGGKGRGGRLKKGGSRREGKRSLEGRICTPLHYDLIIGGMRYQRRAVWTVILSS